MAREFDAFDAHLGRLTKLSIQRFGPAGAFLRLPGAPASSDPETLLLLGPEIPEGAREGDALSVFVYLDSEGRPLATTKLPLLTLGEVAFLRITACTHFGAFADWGLPKELLIPLAEQTREVRVGDRHPIASLDAVRRAPRSRATVCCLLTARFAVDLDAFLPVQCCHGQRLTLNWRKALAKVIFCRAHRR